MLILPHPRWELIQYHLLHNSKSNAANIMFLHGEEPLLRRRRSPFFAHYISNRPVELNLGGHLLKLGSLYSITNSGMKIKIF